MRLQARQEATTSIAATTTSGNASAIASSTGSGSLSTATATTASTLPTPFDSFMNNNFTVSSCPVFFQSFLNNATFQKCTPLSLLLQTSNSFFAAEKSLVLLTQTLEASCNVDYRLCSSVMASLAQDIQLGSNCAADLSFQNPVVEMALNGFLAYDPLYHAGCLTDSGGNYCFANAVTNASAPTGGYIYYLPLGVQLPAGTRPTCDTCLKNTMSVFAAASSNNSVPLSGDYTSAAAQVDGFCGSSFAQASVTTTNAASSLAARPLGLSIIPLIAALLTFIV
ncbi:hypothetical protein LTR85_009588 [Meristemomyces frigidus]|nr:hypothetical protein LTR85_009588 [Meristemomyces frigidus]